jgi:uncharacterized membrane protein
VHLDHYGFGAGWIDGALGLFVLAGALGGLSGRRPKQARLLAERLAREGDTASDELRALLDDRVALAANYGSGLLVLAILALMVWKPR